MAGRRLAVIGGGAMGGALVAGLVTSDTASPEDVAVADVDADRRAQLSEDFGVGTHAEVADAVAGAAIVILAVKQGQLSEVCGHVASAMEPGALVVSIVAGVPTAALEELLPPDTPVVRAMPNVAALVGAAMTAVSPGAHTSVDHVHTAAQVLGGVGAVLAVAEAKLDAVTAVSGSGPAYLFLVAEALIDGGVTMGLSRDEATTLAANTFAGAAKLLLEPGASPAELRARVMSPAGTTAAALAELEYHSIRGAFLAAVQAAADRSAELGEAFS